MARNSRESVLGGHAGGYAGGYAGGHAGGHAGDGAHGLKLGDSYADSLYADALNKQRAAVIDTRPEALEQVWALRDRYFLGSPDQLPRADGNHVNARYFRVNEHVFRWDAWVRKYLAVSELIRYLDFRLTPGKLWNENIDGTYGARGIDSQPKLELFFSRQCGECSSEPKKLFCMTRPKPSSYGDQLALVLQWAELRDERMSEILTQIDNQTPFWGSLLPIQTDRLAHTNELLEIVNEIAVFVEMRFKHELACWRPTDLSPMVQPMITTPGHGSTPSGHATQSYAVLEVLKALLDSLERPIQTELGAYFVGGPSSNATRYINQQMERIAARIATNRVVAGLHFPVDNIAGRILGLILGKYFIHCCGAPHPDDPEKRAPYPWRRGVFDGNIFARSHASDDFDPDRQSIEDRNRRPDYYLYEDPYPDLKVQPCPPVSLLMNLWDASIIELKQLELRFG